MKPINALPIVRRSIMIAGLCIVPAIATAQQQQPQQQQPVPPPNSPLELPEFIVTGKEHVDIPGSAKQAPARPPMLPKKRLDTLNTLEKQPAPAMPARSLPVLKRSTLLWPGYVQAEFGQYVTPDVKAGYSFETGGYRIDLAGGAELSSGHLDNAGYGKYDIRALSTYVAPEKFVFFGGSTTEVDLKYSTKSYRQFALAAAPERSTAALHAGLGVQGRHDGFIYDAGASWTTTSLDVPVRLVRDNVLRGHARIENQWRSFDIGAMADLNIRTYAGQDYPFITASGYGRWVSDLMRVTGGIGFQTARSTVGDDRFGLLIKGGVDLFLGPDLTLQATAKSGLRPVGFADLLDQNPYLNDSIVLDASYDIVDLDGMLLFHPTTRLSIGAGIRLRQTDRMPVWVGATDATFALAYESVTTIQIPGQMRWIPSGRDAVTADVAITNATLSGGRAQPYVPAITASASYDRSFTSQLLTQVHVVYVGDRWADLSNTVQLSGYVDLRLGAKYAVSNALTVQLRAHNLLGSSIMLWEGYRERGIFVSGGITWKF